MNLASYIGMVEATWAREAEKDMYGYGTHEGVLKAWDTRGRKSGGETFVSPNVEENLDFPTALQRLDSPEQQQFLKKAQTVMRRTFGKAEVKSAVGDWADGAENSSIMFANKGKKEDFEYVAALLGKMSKQKQVIAFNRTPAGPDRVWQFDDGPDMEKVRQALSAAGIQYRTLTPPGKANKNVGVYIFDQGANLGDAVSKVAKQFRSTLRFFKGEGKFIGGDTREEGAKAFDEVIGGYKGSHRYDIQ